jgi:predicted transcriptional regulator
LIKGAPRKEDIQAIYKAWAENLFEEKFMERMDVLLWMSEKEVAIVALPKPDGSFDLLGFASKDQRAHKWCGDLFQYFWENEKLGYWIPPSPP